MYKAGPGFVILENVLGAPWVKMMVRVEGRGGGVAAGSTTTVS